MKIHSICLVKDEADIVGDVISDAQKWSDFIYIYDNGSTDGTTEILKNLSNKYSNIIFYKWSDRSFADSMRSDVFRAFKHTSEKGDWWCRLDADEFYIDNPNILLNNIDDGSNAVSNSSYSFYFTDRDLKKYKQNPDSFSYQDLRYYKNDYSEIRFVKDNGHLYWPPSSSWPLINMKIFHKKIRVKHYQYRNPEQIKKRTENRNLAYKNFDPYKKRNIGYLDKSAILDAERKLVSHEFLDSSDGNQTLIARERIAEWKPNDNFITKSKIYFKNILFRLNLLDYIYQSLGKKQ